MLENMGFRVISERTFEVGEHGAVPVFVHDMELENAYGRPVDLSEKGTLFEELFLAVWNARSDDDRYNALADRVQADHGKFDAESALHLMDRPVAMKSNLHNVLFEPKSTKFWVAHASKDGEPAATQPYHAFQLTELLGHAAGLDATELPPPGRREAAGTAATDGRPGPR